MHTHLNKYEDVNKQFNLNETLNTNEENSCSVNTTNNTNAKKKDIYEQSNIEKLLHESSKDIQLDVINEMKDENEIYKKSNDSRIVRSISKLNKHFRFKNHNQCND